MRTTSKMSKKCKLAPLSKPQLLKGFFCRLSTQETIYRWPLKQTEEEMREEERALADQKVISPAQEARVSEVTHNLVQWGRDLVSQLRKRERERE